MTTEDISEWEGGSAESPSRKGVWEALRDAFSASLGKEPKWDILKLESVRKEAIERMAYHGCKGWTFAWNMSKETLGETHYATKTLYLSMQFAHFQERHHITETILHEIAHILAGPKAKHGPKWRETARRIGATGTAKYAPTQFQRFTAYTAICPNGHAVQARNISWESTGKPCKCGLKRHWMTTKKFIKRGLVDTVAQWY